MTVADLIEALQREPQWLEVEVERECLYGNRGKRSAPVPIRAVVPDGSRVLLRPTSDWIVRG